MPDSESLALRNLRTTLRVAADDLRDLEARIKYGITTEEQAFYEATSLRFTLQNELAEAERDRPRN